MPRPNSSVPFALTSAVVLAIALSRTAGAAITLDDEKATHATLSAEVVTMTGRSELLVTGGGDPIPGCTIHLNSENALVFLPSVAPSSVVSGLLGRFRVNGAAAVADTNVRVAQYLSGSVIVAQPSGYQPLEIFTGTHLTGSAAKLSPHTAYGQAALGGHADRIRSFRLKRGYTATFAANENGTGPSRNFVAQDGDLEVSFMPAGLEDSVSFVRVFPWRWTGKKGTCDTDPAQLKANWHYNWSINKNSTRDWEYVAIKQQPYWPGLDQDWRARGVNHVLGFNEPDNPVEDAYKNLTPQGSATDAAARWPELLGTGLRVGAPAVTDGGYGWLVNFLNAADAAGHRVDYVPVHYYRAYTNNNDPAGAANQLYNFLKGIHDVSKRPIWLTEFNNGANWTNNAYDPNVTQNRNVIEAMVQMMDNTPWIERYAVYSEVEWFRKTHYDDGSLTPMGQMYRDRVAPMAYQQAVPNTGTSGNAAYSFEGGFRDTLSGNNPVVYGTPKFVAGRHGTAVSLDGTDDHLSLPGRLGDSTDFSFAAWVKWNGGANWQRIFDLGNGTASNLFLTPKSGGDTLRFAIKVNNGTEQQLNAPPLATGVWTHVAVTVTGDTGKLFVNGALVNTNAAMTLNPSQVGTETNYIGKSQWPDPLFHGALDDVRFFNSGLTDTQIAALAASVPPQVTAPSQPAAAVAGNPFHTELAGHVTGGTPPLTFAKVAGPAWAAVAADGSVTGVPAAADAGGGTLLVRVTSAGGASADLELPVTVAANDLAARFAFDSNTLATAGDFDATASGGPTHIAGMRQQALRLDGADDHLVLPAGVASADEITIATWIYWDGGNTWQRIFDFGNGTGSYFFLTPRSGSNTLRFAIRNGGTEQIVETTQLAMSTWSHVAVTLGGGAARLYVNGILTATNSAATIRPSDIRPAQNYIGRSQFTADPYFAGRLDEFHIFRRALSGAEIAALRLANAPVTATASRTLAAATPGASYQATLAGTATAAGGDVSYEKIGGPAWLTVEPDGRVSGVPGPADAGTPSFRIRASVSAVSMVDFALTVPVAAPAGLLGHWEFDGDGRDPVGGATAVLNGGAVYTPAWFDRAVRLDGTDDHVRLPSGIASSLTDCTFVTRFRWDGGNAWQRVFDFGNNTTQYFVLTPSSASGTLRFAITLNGNASQQFIETAPAPVGEWTHVAVVLSGDTGTLYVNGAAAASGPVTLDPAQIAPVLNYLGKSQWPDPYFNGAIDDFRIYSRALDAAEVRALVVSPAAVQVPRDYTWWTLGQPFAAPGDSDAGADPDGDGVTNLVEWLLGSDPLKPSGQLVRAARLSAESLGLDGGKDYLVVSARVRKSRPGVTLIPEAAATLDTLGQPASAGVALPAGPPVDDGDFEVLTWYYPVAIGDAPTGFMRLRVELAE